MHMITGQKRTLRLAVASVSVLLAGIIACQVTIPPGTAGNAEPITVSFGLGPTGIFNITVGTPVSHSAQVTGMDAPQSQPDIATLRIDPSDIVVTPIASAQDLGADGRINGSFEVRFRLAGAEASDPCAEGVSAGTFHATVEDGAVRLDAPFNVLSDTALAIVMRGSFTICVEVEGDFTGVVVLSEVSFGFNDPEASADETTGGDDSGPTVDEFGDGGDGGTTDGPDPDQDGSLGDGTGGDAIDEEPTDEESGNGESPPDGEGGIDDGDLPADDPPADEDPPVDDEPDYGLVYANLTNDADQDPDSSFDAYNEYGTISGDGTVIAYLSNVDRTGESDDVPNAEVMVMVNGVKTQVTQTTSITNTSDNTYDVTNFTPFVSADGSVVVFGSDGDLLGSGATGAEQIYAYDVASGLLTQLSALDTPAGGVTSDTVGGPRISANGQVIVWIENDAECAYFGCAVETRLRAADPQGNIIMSMVLSSDFSFTDYALSGDGTTIALISDHDPVGLNADGRNQLFLMSVPGGAVSQLSTLASGGSWLPSYSTPALNRDASVIAVWTNDPTVADSEDYVLALFDTSGNLLSILARQRDDFPAGDDSFGRPRFTPDGRFVSFHTRWSFAYTQRNFRADVTNGTLKGVGIGARTVSPTITDDGRIMILAGTGDGFYPDQLLDKNSDGTSEIWSVLIAN